MSQGKRIRALDGWRGIAILIVTADHFNSANGNHLPWLTFMGQQGVALFFVLSGYLITSLLVQERETTGSVDLRAFYKRRFFRLMPAAWTYLLFVATFHLATAREIVASLFFYRNFTLEAPWSSIQTWHFWSLSIEEQFYLVWPSVVVLAGFRRSRWIAIAAACGFACWRFTAWHAGVVTYQGSHQTQYRADALLLGCAFALLPVRFNPPRRLHTALYLAGFPILLWCLFTFKFLVPFGESVLIAFMIWSTPKFTGASRVLGFAPLAWMGRISYSFYLWQLLLAYDSGRQGLLSSLVRV